jgi:hypothetical protein
MNSQFIENSARPSTSNAKSKPMTIVNNIFFRSQDEKLALAKVGCYALIHGGYSSTWN